MAYFTHYPLQTWAYAPILLALALCAPAANAMRAQMATPSVFATVIPQPDTHQPPSGTALIEGRELLHDRVAVVHVSTRKTDDTLVTFIAVDRLYDGLEQPHEG